MSLTSPEKVIVALAKILLGDFETRMLINQALKLYKDKKKRKILKEYIFSGTKRITVNTDAINNIIKKMGKELCGRPIKIAV